MWIIEPFEVFRLDIFFELLVFGAGLKFDWTQLVHAITYGWIMWPGSLILQALFDKRTALNVSLIVSITALLYVEISQGFQYIYNCGYFGIVDSTFEIALLYLMYRLLRGNKHVEHTQS
jgi:hypothetical protein